MNIINTNLNFKQMDTRSSTQRIISLFSKKRWKSI